jgi:hypothetical protein
MSLASTAAHDASGRFGSALSQNVSMSGALVTTNHAFQAGETVDVAIPTRHCPPSLALPEELLGRATVKRVEDREESNSRVALQFSENMQQSLEFALFMAYMAGRSAPVRSVN